VRSEPSGWHRQLNRWQEVAATAVQEHLCDTRAGRAGSRHQVESAIAIDITPCISGILSRRVQHVREGIDVHVLLGSRGDAEDGREYPKPPLREAPESHHRPSVVARTRAFISAGPVAGLR